MPRRIDLGRAVLALGSALLFISLFMEWYDTGPSGWEVFESLDLVLAALAAAGIFAAVRPDATAPWAAFGVPAAALIIVFVQLVNPPPAAGGGDPSSGAWLGLAGAFLMAAGAALSLAAISVTIQVRERDLRRRMAAVDRRRSADDDVAEDLDADADGPVGHEPRMPSLFGNLGRHRTEPATGDEPPLRTGRFTPQESAGEEEAAGTAHRTAHAARATGDLAPGGGGSVPSDASDVGGPPSGRSAAPDGDELERTQPMSALPDEDDSARS
jgi:hypothetical protein